MNLEKQLEEIEKSQHELKTAEENLKEKIAKKYFSQFTLTDLEKIWNSNKTLLKRYDILDKNPNVYHQLQKLDSYGGLRETELFTEVCNSKWDDSQWLNMTELYEEFCKKDDTK